MRPCPRCGSVCPDEAVLCPNCGFSLVPAGLGQTFVGHRPPDAAAPQGPAPAQPSLRGTMIGVAPLTPAGGPPNVPPAGEPAPPTAPGGFPTAPGGLKRTMLGIAPLDPAAPPQNPWTQTMAMDGGTGGVGAPPPAGSPAAAGGVPKGTLLGMPAIGQFGMPAGPPAQPPEGGGGLGAKKTIMGVARPGIAPLNPGVARPVEPAAPAPAWSPLPPPPPAPGFETPVDAPPLPAPAKTRRIPVIAALVIVLAAALFTAAGVALFLYRARGEIQTSLTLGSDGKETLVLTCPGCNDGAIVRFESTSATFREHKATLALTRELAVGDNKLTVALERRPGKTESVELSVPVEFRVRGDTSDLSKTPPAIKIVAQAIPGSAVVIDGKAVPLAADGTATLAVDVARSLTGPDPVQRTLEHRVPYAVTPPGGSPKQGEVAVRIGITPLVLQAPGESIVVDQATFVLAGRTAKSAVVTVEGRPITVDPAGQFAQVMGVSAEGETTVVIRAVAPDQAPRLVPIKVRRVTSLAAEIERIRPQATTSYAAVAQPTDAQRGTLVLLDGVALEVRAESFTTVFLMETKSGCASAPCLARVTWGSKATFAEGDTVSVSGTLAGAVDGPRAGTKIPSINASFVAKGKP